MWASDCFVFVIFFTFSQLPEASVDSKSMWAKFDHVEWLLRLIASSLTYDKGWCGGFLKWGYKYPQIIDFNRIFHYTLSIWWYHWWKPPCQIGWFSDFQRGKVTMGYPSKPVKYHRIRSLKDILRRPWNQKNIALQSLLSRFCSHPSVNLGTIPWGLYPQHLGNWCSIRSKLFCPPFDQKSPWLCFGPRISTLSV